MKLLHPHQPWIEWQRIDQPTFSEFLFALAVVVAVMSLVMWFIMKVSKP